MRKTFNCDALENEGVRELMADEMADMQGGTAVEYAVNLALYIVLFIATP
jgi:hypothetical protein